MAHKCITAFCLDLGPRPDLPSGLNHGFLSIGNTGHDLTERLANKSLQFHPRSLPPRRFGRLVPMSPFHRVHHRHRRDVVEVPRGRGDALMAQLLGDDPDVHVLGAEFGGRGGATASGGGKFTGE